MVADLEVARNGGTMEKPRERGYIVKSAPETFGGCFDLNQSARRLRVSGLSMQPLIKPDHEQILSLAEETKFAENGIVSRTLLRTPNGRVVLFGFAQGQELSEHTSTQFAIVQILSGECQFSLGGKAHNVKGGDFVYMPPNLPHALKATTQFSMLLTLFKPEVKAAGIDLPHRLERSVTVGQ
jgi:quercetin dioxygenase-like cupin family protein